MTARSQDEVRCRRFELPEAPEAPGDEERASADLHIRYEDVAQDGRLVLEAMPQALGAVVWSRLAEGHALSAARRSGVVPVLTRLAAEGYGGPIAVGRALRAEGSWRLARTEDSAGNVDRILLDMWAVVHGIKGHTYGPRVDGAGEPVELGRVFARHVFSRLFAPPGQRKVLRLEMPGLLDVPKARASWQPLEELLELPEGAVPLEPAPNPDPAPVVFGLCHTDSNQHVNSLVYPRLFEEAVLRRLAQLGQPTRMLARFVDVGYRKPYFAGDRARILLRAFSLGERFGAVGSFISEAEGARPHAYLTMLLAP